VRTLPWARNPVGLAKNIHSSGEDDEKIAAWLTGGQDRLIRE